MTPDVETTCHAMLIDPSQETDAEVEPAICGAASRSLLPCVVNSWARLRLARSLDHCRSSAHERGCSTAIRPDGACFHEIADSHGGPLPSASPDALLPIASSCFFKIPQVRGSTVLLLPPDGCLPYNSSLRYFTKVKPSAFIHDHFADCVREI